MFQFLFNRIKYKNIHIFGGRSVTKQAIYNEDNITPFLNTLKLQIYFKILISYYKIKIYSHIIIIDIKSKAPFQ